MDTVDTRTPANSRPFRRFVALALAVAALPFLAVGLVTWFGQDKPPTEAIPGDLKTLYAVEKTQRFAVTHSAPPRVLLAGGSSTLYSLRAATIRERTGLSAVNVGLAAGLGTEYLLWRAWKLAKPGDVVVLTLEYQLYRDLETGRELAYKVLTQDSGFLRDAGWTFFRDLARSVNPAELTANAWKLATDGSEPFDLTYEVVDVYGDVVANARERQTGNHLRNLASHRGAEVLAFDPARAGLIEDYLARFREKGVRVLAGFPPIMDNAAYHSGEAWAFFRRLEAFWAEHGVPALNRPEECMFPEEDFFDTNYHLLSDNADRWSAVLAGRLETLVAAENGARTAAPRLPP